MYNTNLVIDSRMAARTLYCKDCHMNFKTPEQLDKHKQRFCIGSTSDPDDLQLRRGFRSTSPRKIISPDDRDEYRRNPNQDLQLRNLAQNHGKYMEHLNLRNRDLENQREDIRKQLENLGRKTVAPPQDNTADLLRELREQEMRNQRSLDDLKRQLQDLHGSQRTNVIEIERPVYQQPPAPAPPPQPEPPHRPFVFPIYYGKSLVAELSAIRQAYVNNDGNDPEVLAQMAQMMAEAQAIEDEMNKKPEHKSPREKPKDTDNTYRLLTFENDRLNQELRLIQEQNNLAQNRRKSDKEGNQVHLHFTLPKYAFTEKRLKNRKVVRKDSFQASGTNDGLVGLFQPAQSFSYIQQQPLTFYNFPQDQPSVPSYRLQVQQPENSYFQQTQNQYLQQQTEGLYSTTKQQPLKSCYNVPKREHDARSYHSEPRRKSRSGQKVIKFTASHQLDGTVRISRSNSFGYIGRRPRIPPLDLRGLTSPTGNKSGKENTNEKKDDKSVKQDSKIAGGKELRPVDTKLSHVSEGVEPGLRPLADAGTTHLPVLPGQEQKSRPGSQAKPLTRSGHDKPPQIYNYDTGSRAVSPEYRPESNQSLISQRSYLYDADSPMRSEGSLVQDEEPNVAWQVKRSSPGQQNPYEVQY